MADPAVKYAVGCTKAPVGAGDINPNNATDPVWVAEVSGADVSAAALLHHPGFIVGGVKVHPGVAVEVMNSLATSHNPLLCIGSDPILESAVESVVVYLNTAGTKDMADITSYICKATCVAKVANLWPVAPLGPDEHHSANCALGGDGATRGTINAELEIPAMSYCVHEVGDHGIVTEVVECTSYSTVSHD